MNMSSNNSLRDYRVEINGLDNISKYCKQNTLSNEEQIDYKVNKKTRIQSDTIQNCETKNHDFNFKVSLMNEEVFSYSNQNDDINTIVHTWRDLRKIFRYLTRHTLSHPDLPLKVDVSIVKQSNKEYNKESNMYDFIESGLLKSKERYEIEKEIDNERMKETFGVDEIHRFKYLNESI